MARLTIDLPPVFHFSASIPVRITDLNYGGHVGNDTVLSLIHEGRMQYLQHHGYSEKDFGGKGLIMGDVAIVFKNELFYGDMVRISVAVSDFSKVSFDLHYLLEKEADNKMIPVAQAKTGMVCFDYERRRVAAVPDEVRMKLQEM